MDSVVPPSITSKGLATHGSVLEHSFGKGDPYTLGVEEEYMLLDATTFDLVQHIDTVLAAVEGSELESIIRPELMQSVLEISTPVCRNVQDVDHQLRKLRTAVTEIARERDMRVGSAGTHPFSLFERQRITARDRYRALVDQMQYVARRELIFGMHIHVAIDEPEKAIKVVNGLLVHLPQFLATLGQLAVLARRGDRPRVHPAARLRRLPALGAAAAVQGLRRLRGGRRTSSSAPAASPTTRTSGGTSGRTRASGRSRSASATPSRGSRTRSRSRRTASRSSSTTASATSRARRSPRTTAS